MTKHTKPDFHGVKSTLQKYTMAMTHWNNLDELRMNLFATTIIMLTEMTEDERNNMMSHLDSVRVLYNRRI